MLLSGVSLYAVVLLIESLVTLATLVQTRSKVELFICRIIHSDTFKFKLVDCHYGESIEAVKYPYMSIYRAVTEQSQI